MKSLSRQGYPVGDFKTARDWHVYHVYNDPEFIKELSRLDSEFEIHSPKGHTGTAREIALKYKEIQLKYAVTSKDIDFYLSELHLTGGINKESRYTVLFDNQSRKFTATIDPNITKEEFGKMWNYIERMRKFRLGYKQSKRKVPEDTKLLYAIFKARQQSPTTTFTDIFDKYQKGTLPYYEGETTNWLSSADSLRGYYNCYKPKRGT